MNNLVKHGYCQPKHHDDHSLMQQSADQTSVSTVASPTFVAYVSRQIPLQNLLGSCVSNKSLA